MLAHGFMASWETADGKTESFTSWQPVSSVRKHKGTLGQGIAPPPKKKKNMLQ